MSPEKEDTVRADPIRLKRPEPIGADKSGLSCEELKSRKLSKGDSPPLKVPKASSPQGERTRLPSTLDQSPVQSTQSPTELHMSESGYFFYFSAPIAI